MLDETLENDISCLVGRYVGVARRIEILLDELSHQERDSSIESVMEDIIDRPAVCLRKVQETIVQDQAVLTVVKRPELIQEGSELLKRINVVALEHMNLDHANFMHGYWGQLETYKDH